MELFGLILSIPFTLIVSVVFCFVARRTLNRFDRLRRVVPIFFAVIFPSVLVEIVGLSALGALGMHDRFGTAFDIMRTANFFFAAPALACLVLWRRPKNARASRSTLGIAILACWMICVVSVFSNVFIDEAIHGVDGMGIVTSH